MLTDKHFCYVLFLEMSPEAFISFMHTNTGVNISYLQPLDNIELYIEAKKLILEKEGFMDVSFDFAYKTEPLVFNKYISGKLDRPYKICIFEAKEEDNTQWQFNGKTSDVYCDGKPLFFDGSGNMIKNSEN